MRRVLPVLLLLHASAPLANGTAGVRPQASAPSASGLASARTHAASDAKPQDAAASSTPEARDVLLRRLVARVALAQVRKQDAAWHPDQRDCAGLIRFAFRSAYKQVASDRLSTPLWHDGRGRPSDFADAEVLLQHSFQLLGRDDATRESLRTGDVLAFRQEQDAGPIFHLMLVVRPEDRAHAPARVVYHPGEKGAAVRTGVLHHLATEAPLEWRPVPQNASFLGFFRFKEWMS
ncbi:DUF1175 family protein [Myxococcus sp. AM009]|uniref:DUF1175 family protein n=1 Tax=Myxococcus sp. AM009 TaxID=2745137 RepID=UPI0015959F5C|nr:DUF1175 family protein [Myxococcus sp. AM009]NVJ01300.1 DUF1175 family protein [Myxococcus sp. AM009]